jgi:23S rRNA (guanosine2251-2'-O)-methyltransferase
MRELVLIAHDLRSCHNVGSLIRTAEGLGIRKVFLTGYTPYPIKKTDTRLPHIAIKLHNQIHKTALGTENTLKWTQNNDVHSVISKLKLNGYRIVALEQTKTSIKLPDYKAPDKVALMLGREVEGIDQELLNICDDFIEIPMVGTKESFNVVQAAAMALYQLRFHN